MKAAVVHAAGAVPAYGDFPEPEAREGEVLVAVAAASMSQVVKSRPSAEPARSCSPSRVLVGTSLIVTGSLQVLPPSVDVNASSSSPFTVTVTRSP